MRLYDAWSAMLDRHGDVMLFVMRHRSTENVSRLLASCPDLGRVYFRYEAGRDSSCSTTVGCPRMSRVISVGEFVTTVLAVSPMEHSAVDQLVEGDRQFSHHEMVFLNLFRGADSLFVDIMTEGKLREWHAQVFEPYVPCCTLYRIQLRWIHPDGDETEISGLRPYIVNTGRGRFHVGGDLNIS